MSPTGPIAAWAVAAVLTGAVAGALPAPPWVGLGAGVAGVVAAAVAAAARRGTDTGRGRGWRGALGLVAVVLVVAGGASVRAWERDHAPLAALARRGGEATAELVVVGDARPGSFGGWWALVRVERLDGAPTRERALLRGEDDAPLLGTRVATRLTARPVDDGPLAWRHVGVAIRPAAPLRTLTGPDVRWRSTEHVRARLADVATAALSPDRAALATGLVTGDVRAMSPGALEDLRATGLTHLVAVSGSNVAVVVAAGALAAGALGLGARGRRLLVAALVAWFVLLTRAEPSVLRAAVMAGVVLASRSRGVLGHAPHALAVAVLVLLLADPLQARSLGLLLSALATAGVLVLTPLVRPRLDRLPSRVADLLAVTLAAQLAVAPLLLVTIGEVPTASIPANLVAVPAAAVASIVLTAVTVAALVSPALAALLVPLAGPALGVVLGAAHALAGRGAAVTPTRPVTVVAALGAATWLLARRPRLRAAGFATALAVVGAGLVPVDGGPVTGLVVTAIDVGQGDAVLVQAPGATVLVDTGPDRAAAAWLRRRGVRRVDLLVVTHPHADHVGGLADVLATVDVGRVWIRPEPAVAGGVDPAGTADLLGGRAVDRPVTGWRATVGELSLRVLGPPPGRPYRGSEREVNDSSIVIRATWRGRTALLTGDVEIAAQTVLLDTAGGLLDAGLLKVPHHGAGTTSAAFLTAVAPEVALVPVGRANRYGHPHAATLATLEALGARVRRTDEEGTIRAEVPASGPEAGAAGRRRGGRTPWLRSRHDHLPLARDRRRRPAPAAGGRAAARPAPRRRPRAVGRDPRRRRVRAPPGAQDRVAVRWPDLRRPARLRGPVR